MRTPLLFAILYSPCSVCAQDMLLYNGEMVIAAGTRMALDGALNWTIGVDANMVNHGTIECGSSSLLIEAEGSPVQGAGTETAIRSLPAAFNAVEPGGLGLMISASEGIGDLLITRGHEPFVLTGGVTSVARWFRIETVGTSSTTLDIAFRYDPTELNGLDATDLLLRQSPDLINWTTLQNDAGGAPNILIASAPAPWGTITAFDADDLSLGLGLDHAITPDFALRGGIGDDHIVVISLNQAPLRTWELFDTRGRMVSAGRFSTTGTVARIPAGNLAAGMLLVRINGWSVHKWMQ